MKKTTTTVTEIEYDANGRVVKETKTVTENDDRATGGVVPPPQPAGWGIYPTSGYGSHLRPRGSSPLDGITYNVPGASTTINVKAETA